MILSSKEVEKKVLSSFFSVPTHIRVLDLDLGLFNFQEHKNLAKLIQKYVTVYKQPPTLDTLKIFANSLSSDDKTTEEYVEVLKLAKDLPKIGIEEANFYFEQLENYKMGRDIYDLATDLKEKFENNESDFFKIRQNLLDKLLRAGKDKRHIKRNFIYETVPERWEEYKRISSGLDKKDIIPWGIKDLDKTIGGFLRSHVTLLYARTSGGKTIAAINAAYNAALAGYHVMFFTLEMKFNNIASKFDSRMAWVDSHDILFGKLRGTDIKQYNNALKKQLDDKLGIWLVDIPKGTQATDIMKEIELYKFMHGFSPDLVIIDYANLVKPSEKFQGRSERYDYLFSEFHEIARYYNVAVVTGVQESRTATKADKEKKKNGKDEDTEGVENIGLSAGIAYHCETILRLKQDKYDELQHRLKVVVDKNRYGKARFEIDLFAMWEYTYVGDRDIIIPSHVANADKLTSKDNIHLKKE